MIIGTTDQLPVILIVIANGAAIAVILHFIKKKKHKYFFGGMVALTFSIWLSYQIFLIIEKHGISGGVIGLALLALFAFSLAMGFFLDIKNAN